MKIVLVLNESRVLQAFIGTFTYIKWLYIQSSMFLSDSYEEQALISCLSIENKLFEVEGKPCLCGRFQKMNGYTCQADFPQSGWGRREEGSCTETSWSGKWYPATWSVGPSQGIISGRFMVLLTSYKSSKFERWRENTGNAKALSSTILWARKSPTSASRVKPGKIWFTLAAVLAEGWSCWLSVTGGKHSARV